MFAFEAGFALGCHKTDKLLFNIGSDLLRNECMFLCVFFMFFVP